MQLTDSCSLGGFLKLTLHKRPSPTFSDQLKCFKMWLRAKMNIFALIYMLLICTSISLPDVIRDPQVRMALLFSLT